MDPRHPEVAITRIGQLVNQFNGIMDKIRLETTRNGISAAEREGSLVVQEICLVAPRLHEAMMQTSRQRRYELSHGIAFGYTPEKKVGKYTKATIGIEEKPAEKTVEKPKKKTTRKKKTAKKAEK